MMRIFFFMLIVAGTLSAFSGRLATADVIITLPEGFKAITIVEELGRNRHIAVNGNGDIYVKLEKLKEGKGIIVLRNNNGKYEVVKSFGNYTGTGIIIRNSYLYATSDNSVYRYKLNANNEVADPDHPEKIVTDLLVGSQHTSKSIALDNDGNLYVTIGAPSNACQVQDRTPASPGQDPCPLLEKAGGVWQFKADKLNQSYTQGTKFVTGIRNIVGIDWNAKEKQLYAVQHGRDQLSQLFPGLYNNDENAELPAEEFLLLKKGSDFGWPYCYYDHLQKKKVLGPEYGGDGKKQGRCADKDQPIMGFPGHWAPNDLLFYTGKMFPDKYKNGAFIAFHGSWNRAPLKQAGFNVVFVPFKNGKPSGNYEIFANGFTGKESIAGPGQAKYRPCGLAQGPDGALYISDDRLGRIWKIVYGK
ncbi:MAG TPA: PQQ-dependent sugar dehydrogenase [Chitinophagaceae bacterium]|nr:PQQ-dependent sugar dehydrogenase [Chitinophagaceae bacterium]